MPTTRRSISRAEVEPVDDAYDEEGAAALEEVLTAARTSSAAPSGSSAPAAAQPSRVAELEALVAQLRARSLVPGDSKNCYRGFAPHNTVHTHTVSLYDIHTLDDSLSSFHPFIYIHPLPAPPTTPLRGNY